MKKVVVFILMAALLLCGMPVTASAAGTSIEVTLTKNYTNCVFQIRWQNSGKPATVSVTSPSGKTFSKATTPDVVTVEPGNVLINVGAAVKGAWIVTVSGKGLGKITVDGGQLPGNMNIDSFTVKKQGGKWKADWRISDAPNDLHFEIYADTDNKGYDGQKVASFDGKLSGEKQFDISGLPPGCYFFYLCVTHSSGMFNRAYTKGAALYNDVSAPAKLNNMKARMLDSNLFLTWHGDKLSSCRIFIYDAKTRALIHKEDVSGETDYTWIPTGGVTAVYAGVAALIDNHSGQFDLFKVELKNPVNAAVTFPKEKAVNSRTITAQVRFAGSCKVRATLNGSLLLKGASAQGPYQITMDDGSNTIVFLIEDKNGNSRSFTKKLYVDTSPPQLSIRKDINGTKTVQGTVYLTGYTEQGVSLTLNGKPAKMVDGYFSLRCELSFGKNTITLSAKDVAGNESVYSAEVTRSFFGSTLMYIVIGGAVTVILAALYIFIFFRGASRKKYENN